MAKKRLIDIDPVSGTKTWHEYDHLTKATTITSEYADVSLDPNKTAFNDESLRADGIKRGWWHVASIPMGVIERWMREDGIDVFRKADHKRVVNKLNDRDWRYLRTSRGRLA